MRHAMSDVDYLRLGKEDIELWKLKEEKLL